MTCPGEVLTARLRGLTPQEAAVRYPAADPAAAAALLEAELARDDTKIVVLDDDPTGVQTVHGISVFTDFSQASIAEGFDEPGGFFHPHQSAALPRGATRLTKGSRATSRLWPRRNRGLSLSPGRFPMRSAYAGDRHVRRARSETDLRSRRILVSVFPGGGD